MCRTVIGTVVRLYNGVHSQLYTDTVRSTEITLHITLYSRYPISSQLFTVRYRTVYRVVLRDRKYAIASIRLNSALNRSPAGLLGVTEGGPSSSSPPPALPSSSPPPALPSAAAPRSTVAKPPPPPPPPASAAEAELLSRLAALEATLAQGSNRTYAGVVGAMAPTTYLLM